MEVLDAKPFQSNSSSAHWDIDDPHKINEAEQDAIEALSQIFFLNASGTVTARTPAKAQIEEKGKIDQRPENQENPPAVPKDQAPPDSVSSNSPPCNINNNGTPNCTFNAPSLPTETLKETEVLPSVTVLVTKEPINTSTSQQVSQPNSPLSSMTTNCSESHVDLREGAGKKRKASVNAKASAKEIRTQASGHKPTPISPKFWEQNQQNLFSAAQSPQTIHPLSPQPGSLRKDYPFLATLPQLQATATTSFVPLSPLQATRLRTNQNRPANYRRSSVSHTSSSSISTLKNYVSEPNNSNFPHQPRSNSLSFQPMSQCTAFHPFQSLPSTPAKFSSTPVDSSCPLPSFSETTSTISFPKGNLSLGSTLQASSSSASSYPSGSPTSPHSPASPHSPSQSPKSRLSFHPSSPPSPSSPSSPGAHREEPPEESKLKLQQQIQDLIAVHQEKLRFDLKNQIQKHYDLHFQQQAGIKQQVQHLIKKYQERKMICPHPPNNERLENILYGPDECAVREGN